MSALPAALSDADRLELALHLLEVEDFDTFDRLFPPRPKPEPSWLQRFHKRSDKSQSLADFDAAERAKVSANSNRPNTPQPRGTHGIAGAQRKTTPVTLPRPPHSPSIRPSNAPTVAASKPHVAAAAPVRLHVAANSNRPPWSRLSESVKLSAIGTAAEAGTAYAFTVQTSARREESLRAAAAAGRDIRQIVADGIARQFRRLGLPVPPFLFGIEISPRTGRVHIHGDFVPADHSPEYLAAARDAFCHALGKIPGQAGSTQFDAEQLYDAERWRSYFTKAAGRVRRELGLAGTVYVSRKMRQFGRDHYEAIRKPALAPPIRPANPQPAAQTRTVSRPGTASRRACVSAPQQPAALQGPLRAAPAAVKLVPIRLVARGTSPP